MKEESVFYPSVWGYPVRDTPSYGRAGPKAPCIGLVPLAGVSPYPGSSPPWDGKLGVVWGLFPFWGKRANRVGFTYAPTPRLHRLPTSAPIQADSQNGTGWEWVTALVEASPPLRLWLLPNLLAHICLGVIIPQRKNISFEIKVKLDVIS